MPRGHRLGKNNMPMGRRHAASTAAGHISVTFTPTLPMLRRHARLYITHGRRHERRIERLLAAFCAVVAVVSLAFDQHLFAAVMVVYTPLIGFDRLAARALARQLWGVAGMQEEGTLDINMSDLRVTDRTIHQRVPLPAVRLVEGRSDLVFLIGKGRGFTGVEKSKLTDSQLAWLRETIPPAGAEGRSAHVST